MFGFFKGSIKCPVEESKRVWLDEAFLWLLDIFGEEHLRAKPILTPEPGVFPFEFSGEEQNAYDVIGIIAPQMDLDPENIEIEFYSEPPNEIATGGAFVPRVFLNRTEGETYTAGEYWGINDRGKYYVGLETSNLKDPQQMIATLAHELAHIKLLEDAGMEENDEHLTDLLTVAFGLGIFGANSAFQFKTNLDSWGYSRTGYLEQVEWGYSLALYSYFREDEPPVWAKFLSTNVKHDLAQSVRFIEKNPEKIFQEVVDHQ